MNNLTIYQLRKEMKMKVRVTHWREVNGQLVPMFEIRKNLWQNMINPMGGLTVIEVTDEKGNEYKSQARCSNEDTFNRKVGLIKAVGRLHSQLFTEDGKRRFQD